jgi:SAM-dependent methyltransferase
MPELLEHVVDWQSCLKECDRVLRPNGLLYLSTSNKLCPSQQEFDLPLYSWYPGFLKRRYERLAVTTRPELVNHATYPAVNWFSFYSLRTYLRNLGFDCMDRFDAAALHRSGVVKPVLAAIRHIPLLRFFGHVATPYTVLIAIKRAS